VVNGGGKQRHPFNISVPMLFLFILKTNTKFSNIFGKFHLWTRHLHDHIFIETASNVSLDPLLIMTNYSVIKMLTSGDKVSFYCCGK
jgi:hypothetical protein